MIEPPRRLPGESQTRLREYALLAPRLVKLVWRLARDPRVPARSKAMLFVVAGYLASPIDVLPDFLLPGLGQLDDLVLAALALDQILNRVPEDVVRSHWDGDDDVLDVVRQTVDVATSFVPERVRRRFGAS